MTTAAEYVSVKQSARIAGVSTRTVHRWIERGVVAVRRLPSGWPRVRASDLLSEKVATPKDK